MTANIPALHILRPAHRGQSGTVLVISLAMLFAALILGLSAARNALEGEKAARNDRDRRIAFEAAEAALTDAELDIENSPDAARSRSSHFSKSNALGFPDDDEPPCRSGDSADQGLCRHPADGETPIWQAVNFLDTDSASAASVAYGRFTGQRLAVGKGSLPARLPRYVIELMKYNRPGESAEDEDGSYFYRVTAIGFGARETTQVVLQTFYRKAN